MMSSLSFQTLKKSTFIQGVGLHSGADVRVELRPSTHVGIRFIRADQHDVEIPASFKFIKSTFHATKLAHNNIEISTPEHLLAALWGMGITHCDIIIDGAEVPILDGSAALWCELIRKAGVISLGGERPIWQLAEPVRVEQNGAIILAVPDPHLRLTVVTDFDVDYLPPQIFDKIFSADSFSHIFVNEISPARTFALEKWIEPLQEQGFIRGGSLDNALVLGDEKPSSALRFSNELARHKALDALGDFALLTSEVGAVFHAHFILIRAGHGMHSLWMKEVSEVNHITIPYY